MSPALHQLRGTWRKDRHERTVGATARALAPAPAAPVPPPAHLQPETQHWHDYVTTTWVLDRHHVLLLRLACETWDQAQAAREKVSREGLTVPTAGGDRKAHPCLTTATTARTQFASLVAALELDDDAGTPGGL